MTKQEIIEKLNVFVAAKAGVDVSVIHQDTDLEDDLGIDYIQRLELAVDIEQDFSITVPGYEATDAFTMQQWYDLVDGKVNPHNG